MIVGLCYPSPGPSGDIDSGLLEILKLTGITHVRFDLHLANPRVGAMIAKVRAAGLGIMPIIEYEPTASPQQLAEFANQIVTDYALDSVEVLNEPSRVMTPQQYHDILEAVGASVKGKTRVLAAGEFLIADRKGPGLKAWFKQANLDPELYDAVAIHPYREPGPPSATRYGTRSAEYEVWKDQVPPGKPLIITEVGWHIPGVDEELQGAYIYEELSINHSLGLEAVYVYTNIADPSWDFGVFRTDRSPRPAAYLMALFNRTVLPSAPSPLPTPYKPEVPPAPTTWPSGLA